MEKARITRLLTISLTEELVAITHYQSTWNHLIEQKALKTRLVCYRVAL